MARPEDLGESKQRGEYTSGSCDQNTIKVFAPREPAIWVADGPSAALENNGYEIAKVDQVTDAKTMVAIKIAVVRLGLETTRGLFIAMTVNGIEAHASIYRMGQLVAEQQ